MAVHDDILRLVKLGRHGEAIQLGESALSDSSGNAYAVRGNLALAYLALGRFDVAYQCFADRDASELPKRLGLRFLDLMARAAWLKGNPAQGLQHAKLDVQLLMAGETGYADASGGVSNALFLYYCARKLSDDDAKILALTFLRKISTRPSFSSWPGPLGSYYLGNAAVEDVLLSASKHAEIDSAVLAARHDILTRRQMVGALFYVGVKALENGNSVDYAKMMAQCCALENPYTELEWYLAQKEIQEGGANKI